MKQLGEILLDGGLLTEDQLTEAFNEHQREGRALGRVLVERGFLTESQLVAALAEQIGLPFIDLGDYPADGAAVASVPPAVCRRYNALPVGFDEDGRLIVAMSDPANVFAIDDIRSLTGRDVKPAVATKADVSSAICEGVATTLRNSRPVSARMSSSANTFDGSAMATSRRPSFQPMGSAW